MMKSLNVAVLGLGRLGSAVATRAGMFHHVRTWNRTSMPSSPGWTTTPADAVTDADVVLVCLYDATACRSVLESCLDSIPETATVVNNSTVSPAEAEQLAQLVSQHGRGYLHAPVIGSVAAVESGRLTILTGGKPIEPARKVLESLGEILVAETSGEAAALKLVANGVLGDTLLALRRALHRGEALSLPRATVLDMLERTALSGTVSKKRDLLTKAPSQNSLSAFTVAALGKDLRLLADSLAATTDASAVLGILLSNGALDSTDDVARLSAVTQDWDHLADARLTISPDVTADPAVLDPLYAYARGHATGDPEHFRRAFLPTAHIEGRRDGAFTSWGLQEYCGLFNGPALDEQDRRRTLDHLTVRGTIATATMTLRHGSSKFVDMFVLITDAAGNWRIANKVYERQPG
ncbi:nuclear transport factor 2 family protein [Kribbella deserti]|uniref:Nuclear transport factor 2 family protein n=1 Tax=Kribbella deserti TaxID=1926257 RepID=A0ABV6QFG2_9ACTN